MKKANKSLVYGAIGLGVVLAGGLIYWFVSKDDNHQFSFQGQSSNPSLPEYPVAPSSRGEHVKTLQRKINSLMPSPYLPLQVDGIYGDKTRAAALKYLGKTRFSEAEIKGMKF